jgi:hypothetical protein
MVNAPTAIQSELLNCLIRLPLATAPSDARCAAASSASAPVLRSIIFSSQQTSCYSSCCGDCAINSLFVTLQKSFWRGVSSSSRKFYAIVAVRDWEARFAPSITEQLRARRRGKAGRSWYTDETYVKVGGKWAYPYRAIDRAESSLRKAAHEPENGFVAIRHSVASTAGIRNETMPELMIQGRVRYRGQMEATSRARSGSCRWHSNWLPKPSPSFVSACPRLVGFSCCNATLFSVP